MYGDGVVLSRDPASFRDLMELVSGLDRSQSLILQQYIGTRPGKDLRVWVIGGQVHWCHVAQQHRWQFQGKHQ